MESQLEPRLPLDHPREGPVAASALLKGAKKRCFTFKNGDPCERQCWRQLSMSADSFRCLMVSFSLRGDHGVSHHLWQVTVGAVDCWDHTHHCQSENSACHLFSQQTSEDLGKGGSFLASGRTYRSAREYPKPCMTPKPQGDFLASRFWQPGVFRICCHQDTEIEEKNSPGPWGFLLCLTPGTPLQSSQLFPS